MTHELRRHPRVEFDRRVWCEHTNLTLYLQVANVSLGGMFLQTSAQLYAGETMRVSLDVEGEPAPVVAEVEVVWSGKSGRGSGVGCKFVQFVQGEQAYARLLDRLARRSVNPK